MRRSRAGGAPVSRGDAPSGRGCRRGGGRPASIVRVNPVFARCGGKPCDRAAPALAAAARRRRWAACRPCRVWHSAAPRSRNGVSGVSGVGVLGQPGGDRPWWWVEPRGGAEVDGGGGGDLKHSDGPWMRAAGGAEGLVAHLGPVKAELGRAHQGLTAGAGELYGARRAGRRTGLVGAADRGRPRRVPEPGREAAGGGRHPVRGERSREGVLRRGEGGGRAGSGPGAWGRAGAASGEKS